MLLGVYKFKEKPKRLSLPFSSESSPSRGTKTDLVKTVDPSRCRGVKESYEVSVVKT